MGENSAHKSHLKNLQLEIVNFTAFLTAALKFWDRRMRKIIRGTFSRQIEVVFNKRKILLHIENYRKGNCVSCGVCCQYIRRCPYLTGDNKCAINDKKHLICRIYPISAHDVQLVSEVSYKKCGYYFDGEK
jgi:hypothetical protein